MKIQFMYMENCPLYKSALENLKKAVEEFREEVDLEILDIESVDMAVQHNFMGSPSIYIDGKDLILGIVPDHTNFALRTFSSGFSEDILSKDYILDKLRNWR